MSKEPTKPKTGKTAKSGGRKQILKPKSAARSAKTVRVGKELSLGNLANQFGVRLVGPKAVLANKTIREAGDGEVLIDGSVLRVLLDDNTSARTPAAGTDAKLPKTAARPTPQTPKTAPRRTARTPKAARRATPQTVSKRETELLKRINVGLSEQQARRLEELDARLREDETLTAEEHTELVGLVDQAERLDVGRTKALFELAQLRGVPVESIMRVLGLGAGARG